MARAVSACGVSPETMDMLGWIDERIAGNAAPPLLRVVRVKSGTDTSHCLQMAWPASFAGIKHSPKDSAPSQWLVTTFPSHLVSATSKTGWIAFYDRSGHLFGAMPRPGSGDFDYVPSPMVVRGFARAAATTMTGLRPNLAKTPTGYAFHRIAAFDNMITVVAMKPNKLVSALSSLQNDFVLSGTALILIALLLSFESARRIAGPLAAFTETTRKIASGAFDVHAPEAGLSEISLLGRAINDMASRIRRLLEDQHHAGRMSAELEAARLVQEMIFPPTSAVFHGFSTFAYSGTATECGGDLWGVFPIPGDRHVVYIADATGHGVASAFLAVAAKSAFSTLEAGASANHTMTDVVSMLRILNKSIYDAGHGNVMMTMLVAIIDPAAGHITFCNAGHTFPLIVSNTNGSTSTEYKCMTGKILGQSPHWDGEEQVVALKPGDQVVLYTDGVTDNPNASGRRLGKRRLKDLVGRIRAVPETHRAEKLREEFVNHLGSTIPEDDSTLVLIEMTDVSRAALESADDQASGHTGVDKHAGDNSGHQAA